MPVFFHVDRGNLLKENQVLTLDKSKTCFFEKGVSRHGERYVYKDRFIEYTDLYYPDKNNQLCKTHGFLGETRSSILEVVFELVRVKHFSEMPSRFQSFFAWETIVDLKKFHSDNNVSIWEVEADGHNRLDMNWLKLPNKLSEISERADKYWKGEESDLPQWEYLLQFPVKILKKVEN